MTAGVALIAALGAAPAAGAAPDPLGPLKRSCQAKTSPDKARYRICTAQVPTFDGTPLDVTLTLPPARKTKKPLPLIAFLHGFLSSKAEYLSDTRAGASAYQTVHWNNIWFASRGYAVLNYSHRGHGNSGGQIELASKDFEVRDAQQLTGLLADAGPSLAPIDPRRIGVIGSSYGGGMAWMLMTTRRSPKLEYGTWRSPKGRLLKLAAVVPTYTWTDLLYSLVPNGRHLSTGHLREAARNPTGIAKQTLLDGFLATAGPRLPKQTYSWLTRVNAGEPYDEPDDQQIDEAKRALTNDRSAYYQGGYFDALRRHRVRRVPVLAGQGWTDPIFPPIEALRMYRRLHAASPGYPIKLYLGDFEHLTSLAKIPDLARLHGLGNRLLDHYLRRRGKRPRFDVRAAVTSCDPKAFGPVVRAKRWGRLAERRLSFDLGGGPKHTTSKLAGGGAGPLFDPVVVSTQRGRGCITTTAGTDPGAAAYPITLPAGTTLMGLPRLTITYTATAPDFELNSRLWDVAPDGTKTLVTRGPYRGGPSMGPATIHYEMFGNAWRMAAGHTLQLELLQDDSTYLRTDNIPSTVTIEKVGLELPVH
ncbi:MAG: type transport system ATP-binding protein [Thermoleophilaceae bacterium]|nr:type transport system ATP-binding protein [Thermoleophilaceae bacterium]